MQFFLIKKLKSLTAFSRKMPIIFFIIHFGICIEQKFSVVPNATIFCLIHVDTILQESNVFVWKDSGNELQRKQYECWHCSISCFPLWLWWYRNFLLWTFQCGRMTMALNVQLYLSDGKTKQKDVGKSSWL